MADQSKSIYPDINQCNALDKLEKWLYEEGKRFEKKCDGEVDYIDAVSACARRAQCYYTIEKINEFKMDGEQG